MSLPWFRMYAEFAKDPKVQSMDETLQRRLVMLFCLKCSDEITLSHDELACALRISGEELETTLEVFRRKGFIDAEDNICNWDKRQFVSDSSTSRVRRYREKQRNGDETLHGSSSHGEVTPPDTDTDTEKKNSCASRDARFSEFWSIYPRKIGKDKALSAWKRKQLDRKADEIIAHLQARIRRDRQWLEDEKFIPYPATFLNRGGWTDEYETVERPRIQGI